jgi:hypothetical protein
MKRLAVLLLLVLLAVPVARAQDDPDIEPGRYVVVGVVLYDKQTGQEIVVYNGASFATATPRPPVDTPTPEPQGNEGTDAGMVIFSFCLPPATAEILRRRAGDNISAYVRGRMEYDLTRKHKGKAG